MRLNKDKENISNLLPYDFVKENNVLAFDENGKKNVISPNNLSIELFHEIQRFLKSSFIFSLCKPEVFNELLTNSFSINNNSSILNLTINLSSYGSK